MREVEVMKQRILAAHRRLEESARRAAAYQRKYQRPLPTVYKEGFHKRDGMTDKVIVTTEVFQSTNYPHEVYEVWDRYERDAPDGVFVCIIVFFHGTGELHGARCFASSKWLDAETPKEMAEAISEMCEPKLTELLITLMESAAAEFDNWVREMERAALLRLEQHKDLIERWEAELAVEELVK